MPVVRRSRSESRTPENRTVSPVTLSVPFLSPRSGTARPVEWVPPIYYRTVSYAAGLLVWGLGFWLWLSVSMVVLPSPVVVENPYSNSEAIYEYASIFASVVSPEILPSALALLVSQLVPPAGSSWVSGGTSNSRHR